MGGGRTAGVITLLVTSATLRPGETVLLSGEEAHHCRVRRGTARENVRVVDGRGKVALGSLTLSG